MSSNPADSGTPPALPPGTAPESQVPSKQTASDDQNETTLEPDWDALWRSVNATEAKKQANALMWRMYKEPGRTFHCDMQSTLPMKLKFLEDAALYPKHLPVDERKQFPLHKVYGGEQAYRGSDKPRFKTTKGTTLKVTEKTSALLVFKDVEADGRLVAFGYPYQSTREDSSKDTAVLPSKAGQEEHPNTSKVHTVVKGAISACGLGYC